MNILKKLGVFLVILLVIFIAAWPVKAQMYQRCQPSTDCVIGEYVFDNNGNPVSSQICTIDIRNPSGSLIIDGASMTANSDGWHYYTANIASPEGFYRALMYCNNSGDTGYIDKSFVLGTSFENVDQSIWSYSSRTLSSFGTLVTDIWASLTSGMTTAGSIGKLLADNIDAAISSSGATAADIWGTLTSSLTTSSSIGKLLVDNINSAISSRSSHNPSDVWDNLTSNITTSGSIGKLLIKKIESLDALAGVNRQLLEKVANAPQIKVWYEKGSIILKAEIKNPSSSLSQTVEFKQELPKEVKPEHIIQTDGLAVKYDSVANAYYLYGEFKLAPQESIIKSVKIKNVWQIADSEINNLKKSASQAVEFLRKSSYFAQGSMLKNDINARLDSIKEKQEEAITPEEYITVYRENLADLKIAKKNFEALNGLVLAWEGEKKVVASIGGIQITATWGIILAVIVGISLLGFTNLALAGKRKQLSLAAKIITIPFNKLIILSQKIIKLLNKYILVWLTILTASFTFLISTLVLKSFNLL